MGSNLADPEAQVRRAMDALASLGRAHRSSLYRTEPLGPADQPWYVNAVVELATDLAPPALLTRLQQIERTAGRVRDMDSGAPQWGPRVLDLDILLFGERVIATPDLEVPHPRFRQRGFVLKPLSELAPALRDPVTRKTVRQLLGELDDSLLVEKLSGTHPEATAPEPGNPTPEHPEVWQR